MPELVALKTEHYECVIWSKDVTGRQQRFKQTMEEREQCTPASVILLSPPINLLPQEPSERPLAEVPAGISEYSVDEAVFFENKQYDIEFVFPQALAEQFVDKPPLVEHRLKSVEDAFHYSPRSHSLRASVNTGNDIGWFKIDLVYWVDSIRFNQSFAFEIMPVKMDMASDLRVINTAIDNQYPLWRYSLAEKTHHQMKAVKKPHSQFLLLWLAQQGVEANN